MSVLVCPVCQGAMREADRDGVLIDVCTQCRGVWLDRGELEKLSHRLTVAGEPGGFQSRRSDDGGDGRRYRQSERSEPYDDDRRYDGHRKKSGVARFLDFFD